MIVGFIDRNRAEFGVEPVCAALQAAPSAYWTSKRRPPSARALRDAEMMPVLLDLWEANFAVCGARKLWIAARRAGHGIGRDQTARLMKRLGIRGVKRQKKVRTARPDPSAQRPGDLVERDFAAEAPNRLWVADLTQVATWSGVAYVCFVTDAFSRRIVGWRVAGHMRTQMVLDALEMARWARGARLEGLIGNPRRGPWRTVDDVELATLGWVHWRNTERIHGYLDDQPPDQFEAAYAAAKTDHTNTEIHNKQPAQNPG